MAGSVSDEAALELANGAVEASFSNDASPVLGVCNFKHFFF